MVAGRGGGGSSGRRVVISALSKEMCTIVNRKCTAPVLRADIQRLGSILAWIVILSVYGADTIAEVKLLISPLLR